MPTVPLGQHQDWHTALYSKPREGSLLQPEYEQNTTSRFATCVRPSHPGGNWA
jgi:hypothetical protein